ncbi:hypothetical protein AB1Y20_019042 [Prymnesium parvum]|uniref:Glycosyl transferase family 25 domain-containing protein n=1 Tax=Prymnesium parvum TaxID=97485 RepID=A0AB34JQ50_PRYPA
MASCVSSWRASHSWRTPRPPAPRSPAPRTSATCVSSVPVVRPPPSSLPLALLINLSRRSDRLLAMRRLPWALAWERVDAIDGRGLSWEQLRADRRVHRDAIREGEWAEAERVPTICRKTGSFSPHLTLAAVGCALSHRLAWERVAGEASQEWVLILEDDIDSVCDGFEQQLNKVFAALPSTAQICFLGYHESTGHLLQPRASPSLVEIPGQSAITGLFGYLLHRRGAEALLSSVFPLRYQVDVAVAVRGWAPGTRYAVSPDAVLITSPKSEVGRCDTDVQTLGPKGVSAHDRFPTNMLRL